MFYPRFMIRIEKLDKEKMAKTAENIKELYNQVSPIFSKLIKK